MRTPPKTGCDDLHEHHQKLDVMIYTNQIITPIFGCVPIDHHTQFLVGFVYIITLVFGGVRVDHHTQFLVGFV
jgi:hypothetical protein